MSGTATTLASAAANLRDAAASAGGWALIVAGLAFVAVFTYLASTFGYPEVLDGKAADVLPALLGLGATGRAVWGLYGLLPLLLIPAGLGAYSALREESAGIMRVAAAMAFLSALAMLLGLLRWPSVHWSLANAYVGAGSDAERAAIAALFDGLNSLLGNFIGEIENSVLPLWMLVLGVLLVRAGRQRG